jgi:hypothetical protein
MINLKNLFSRALLALMLVSGMGSALAGPMYHVTVDTSPLAGKGLLDFSFLGLDSSAAASAMLSNFVGDFAAGSMFEGDAAGDLASGVVLGNGTGLNAFTQEVNLGGSFGFDVRFGDLGPAGDGTTLGVALYSPGFGEYLLAQGNLATFDLMPDTPVAVSFDAAAVNVAEVPEPAALALLVFGLAIMTGMARQRRVR